MVLSVIEEQILIAIYTARVNGGKKVELNDFELTETEPIEKTHEFAYHCENLQRKELIKGYDKAFAFGGHIHPKYHNRALIAYPEMLDITRPGIEYIVKHVAF